VAVGTPKKWEGLYNHFDSYPSGLGAELYEHLTRQIVVERKTLAEVCDNILKFDDWRNYLKGGVCEYCGKITGQAHTISGAICAHGSTEEFKTRAEMAGFYRQLPAWAGREAEIERMVESEFAIRETRARTGYPDPDAKFHQHNSLADVSAEHITSAHSDPLFIEWAYVIDPKAEIIHVLAHQACPQTKLRKTEEELRKMGPVRLKGGRFHYGHCVYKHVLVATLRLTEKPDWEKIECGDLYERCHHYASHHFPELKDSPSGMLGTQDYIGQGPLGMRDACAYIIGGQYAKKGGRGYSGGGRMPWGGMDGVWYEAVEFADGEKRDVPVAYTGREESPYRGVVWVFPPRLTSGHSTRPVVDAAILNKALAESEAKSAQ
jgi:hypothetical protein